MRNDISAYLKTLQSWEKASFATFRFLPKKFSVLLTADRAVGSYAFPDRVVRNCKLFGDGVSLIQCGGDGENLLVTVERTTTTPSGQYALLVDTDAGAVWIDMVVVRQQQLDQLLQQRQRDHPLPASQTPARETTKMAKNIDIAA